MESGQQSVRLQPISVTSGLLQTDLLLLRSLQAQYRRGKSD